MSMNLSERSLQVLLTLSVVLTVVLWFYARDLRVEWGNVPPAPSQDFAASYGLGDASFAYRINGIMIQNLGDTGGRVTALKDYNYEELAKWFFVQDSLDARSSFIPNLAGYYFAAVQEPKMYRPVIDYLVMIGTRQGREQWRWLAQAVFMARFKMEDMDLALELAKTLATLEDPDVAPWARQMPVFIQNARGEKEAAYALMLEILKTSAHKMHPNEVVAMKYYICQRILEKEEAKDNPLCEGIPL